MTTKASLNARVKITAGPATGLFGRISHVDESMWTADVKLDDGRTAKRIPLKQVELIADEPVTDRAKLLDRIRKLWAKAESLKAMGPEYEHEALTFAANAQKMLNKYKLSLDDLAMSEMQRDEPVDEEALNRAGKKRVEDWARSLAHVVARAHFCRAIMEKGSDRIWLVGRETDRKVAMYVLTILLRAADQLSDKAARAFRKQQRSEVGATTSDNKNYRRAWLSGFVERVAERYREEEMKLEREQQQSAGTSLVLVKKNALAQVDSFVDANVQLVAPRRPRRSSSGGRSIGENSRDAGRDAGRAAANTVNIRGTGLGAGSTSSQKRLS